MFVTLTTTPTIEGRRIVEYKGIVFGEVISRRGLCQGLCCRTYHFFGGRSNSYEGELQKAREQALASSSSVPPPWHQRRCGRGPGL